MTDTTASPGRIIATGKGTSGTTYRLRYEHGSSGPMALFVGTGKGSVNVGYVMDRDNFWYAVDEADEETRVLMAQAREEFGF